MSPNLLHYATLTCPLYFWWGDPLQPYPAQAKAAS